MKNYLKFWGTRGSCSVSGPEYQRFGGNTCCLEVRYGKTHIIIDAGTGIRPLGFSLADEELGKIDLFLGHTHWDHIIGFPFFEPLYKAGSHITIWSPAGAGRTCRELFMQLLATEFFPIRLDEMLSQFEFRTSHQKTPIHLGDLTIDFHTTQHPGLTHCFKIQTPHQTIGYITDNEMLQNFHGLLADAPADLLEPHESLIEFMKGCDILIHEAQYFPEEYLHKGNWGHSSARNAVSFIERAKPRHWLVTHHEPSHTDADLDRLAAFTKKVLAEQKVSCPVEWIPDGHIVSLK